MMQVEKSEEVKHLVQVYVQERRHLATRNMFLADLKLIAQRHLEQKIKDSQSKREIGTRTDL